jgi:ankyrin repeat protein
MGDDEGWTSLIFASENGYAEIVDCLLKNGADPNMADIIDEWAPLMLASSEGHIEIVKSLLNKGADPDEINKIGRSALELASSHGHIKIVDCLLKNGANPNNDDGEALIEASKNGHTEIVQMLLEYGADPNIKNNAEFNAIDIAKKAGQSECVRILDKYQKV